MSIYIIIFVLFLIGLFIHGRERYHYAIMIGILLLFLGVFRDNTVGTDISLKLWYHRNWFWATWNPTTWNKGTPFEPGFNVYMVFLKSIYPSYHFFYGTSFFLTFCGFAYFLKKHSKDLLLSVFILYALFFYCTMFNIVRQLFCASLCVIILHYYLIGKLKAVYYIGIVISISLLFHSSNIIWALIPFLRILSNIQIKKYCIYSLCVLAFFLFLNTKYLTPYIQQYSYLLGERYKSYIEWGLYSQSQFSNLEMLLYLTMVCVCTYFHRGNKFSQLFWFFVILTIMRGAFMNIFFIFSRFTSFSNIAMAVVVADIYMSYPQNIRKRNIFLLLMIVMVSIVFQDAISKNYSEVIPYVNTLL